MSRVVVHVLTGAAQADRDAWIARALAQRPAWAVFAPRACPCCVGRVEAQIGLTRLLRERRPARVLLALADARHLAALERTLGDWPLSRYVEPGRVIRLPEDARLAPEALGA